MASYICKLATASERQQVFATIGGGKLNGRGGGQVLAWTGQWINIYVRCEHEAQDKFKDHRTLIWDKQIEITFIDFF